MATTLDLDFTTGTLDPRITFSRASLATYYDSAGVLKYAGQNNIWWSEDFATLWSSAGGGTVTANATTAPDGTTTADRLNHTTAGTVIGGGISQTFAATVINRAVVSVYAKKGTKNFLQLGTNFSGQRYCYFNLATGTVGARDAVTWISSGIADAGNGWWRCWGVCNFNSNAIYMRVGEADNDLNCTSPGDIFIWGAQVENVTTETSPRAYLPTTTAIVGAPRFDYDPVTHAPRGLLIEEARTNIESRSQEFNDAAWVKTGLTVTADATAAPDGTTTADLITASATTATITQTSTGAGAGVNYVHSVFAKKGTSDWIYMVGQDLLLPRAWFNLAAGTVGTVEAGLTSAAIESVGNGWYRCRISDVGDTGTEPLTVGLSDGNSSAAVTVGRTAYVWGAQGELSATFASSYIPTAGSGSIARQADIAVMTGANFSSWYNQPAGTLVAEFVEFRPNNPLGSQIVLQADNATTQELISLHEISATATMRVVDNNVQQASISPGGTLLANTVYKLGGSYALNDIAACLNGGTVVVDTGATMPTPTQLRIGSGAAANYLNGHIRRIQYQNIAVSDAQLQILTTPGAWPIEGSVGAMTGSGAATAVGMALFAGVGAMLGSGQALASGRATVFAAGQIAGTGLGTASAVSAAIARSVGVMIATGGSMAGAAADAGAIPIGPGATSKALARRGKVARERRHEFEKERKAMIALMLERPPLKPAPETLTTLSAIHDEDAEEEDLLLLLLGS
jgi:hypothetical protein